MKMHGVLPGDIALLALRHLFWHTSIQEVPLFQHGYQIDGLLVDKSPLQPKIFQKKISIDFVE